MEQNRIERAPTLGARLQKYADFVREGKNLPISAQTTAMCRSVCCKAARYRLPLRLMFTKGRWKAP